ncbi:B12-binding domain-containing radical SAM protein [candidate division KSB1 bacterium]|nr:B12-binding domain-containing radical SAM protein [candidate division KSB1 bacterium]NIR69276.1 B12-binding domain-containing radical SAM protein [candidate division KSB1 bacterium]NIS24137.1 B12-binding domain-containing radical SAM protein [candidate division KSB1 bacterium]NIT71051.1 B12-binding domain-containing radical SAM protein [candidate division KSB1 bacterium]NIU24756.1 B12-binding domain-containing radical SAM protein [candidate division KSB1 bacterium]
MKKKIILYNPHAVFYTMPLGLLAVASNVDLGQFEVVVVDGRLEKDPVKVMQPHLYEAICLGMSVLTGRPIQDALRVARAVKAIKPDLPVIWGGWHPSLFPVQCLDEPSLDITVQGQGEDTFREMVTRLADGEDLDGLAGCTFRKNGQVIQNPPRPLADMNDLPPANYDLIPVENYYRLKNQRQLDYISSKGCHFRCSFCADPFVFKRKWTALSPQRMGDELEFLWNRYRFDDVDMQDETFFTHQKRVIEIAEEFLRRNPNFTWAATMRADQGTRMEEEDFALCKKSGLRRVLIGVESGSQQMLDWMKKDITLEQIYVVAERCARHDLAVIFPMIVGFPDEPEDSVHSTLNLAKELRAMSPKFTTQIFFYQPYPGSPISEMLKHNGYRLPTSLKEWASFDYVSSSGPCVSPEKWRKIQAFKFYSRFAWNGNGTFLRQALGKLARWRCDHDFYRFPIEKTVAERFKPPADLS